MTAVMLMVLVTILASFWALRTADRPLPIRVRAAPRRRR
jgi:hypothetical protein